MKYKFASTNFANDEVFKALLWLVNIIVFHTVCQFYMRSTGG